MQITKVENYRLHHIGHIRHTTSFLLLIIDNTLDCIKGKWREERNREKSGRVLTLHIFCCYCLFFVYYVKAPHVIWNKFLYNHVVHTVIKNYRELLIKNILFKLSLRFFLRSVKKWIIFWNLFKTIENTKPDMSRPTTLRTRNKTSSWQIRWLRKEKNAFLGIT